MRSWHRPRTVSRRCGSMSPMCTSCWGPMTTSCAPTPRIRSYSPTPAGRASLRSRAPGTCWGSPARPIPGRLAARGRPGRMAARSRRGVSVLAPGQIGAEAARRAAVGGVGEILGPAAPFVRDDDPALREQDRGAARDIGPLRAVNPARAYAGEVGSSGRLGTVLKRGHRFDAQAESGTEAPASVRGHLCRTLRSCTMSAASKPSSGSLQPAIERGRRAAALDVTELNRARTRSPVRASISLARRSPIPPSLDVPERVGLTAVV